METETKTWSEFSNGGKAIVEQILASEEENKSIRAGLWESQSGIQLGKLTIKVRLFKISPDQSSPDLSVPPEQQRVNQKITIGAVRPQFWKQV